MQNEQWNLLWFWIFFLQILNKTYRHRAPNNILGAAVDFVTCKACKAAARVEKNFSVYLLYWLSIMFVRPFVRLTEHEFAAIWRMNFLFIEFFSLLKSKRWFFLYDSFKNIKSLVVFCSYPAQPLALKWKLVFYYCYYISAMLLLLFTCATA